MGDPTESQVDPLAKAMHSLFLGFANVVQGELQCSNNEYELVKDMNLRAATEYDNFGDIAAGFGPFVELLKQKNDRLNHYLQSIDAIDQQVTDLEALVSTLDNYTGTLHAQIKLTTTGARSEHGR